MVNLIASYIYTVTRREFDMKIGVLITCLAMIIIVLKQLLNMKLLLPLLLAPLVFYLITKDKANSLRLAILSIGVLLPLWFIPSLYVLSYTLNDEWIRRVFRWKLIVFTGIDGSGKSTHTKILSQKLKSLGIDVVYYHWFKHPLTTILSILYARLRGKEIITHDKLRGEDLYTNEFRRSRRTSFAIFRPIIQFIDNWLYIGLRIFANMIRGKWVICDRYFYDYFIRMKILGYPIPKILEWLIYYLTPKPHMLIILDVNPLLSCYRRKREHPLWYYVLARKEYHRLAKLKSAYLINTERDISTVEKLIWNLVCKNLNIKKL